MSNVRDRRKLSKSFSIKNESYITFKDSGVNILPYHIWRGI